MSKQQGQGFPFAKVCAFLAVGFGIGLGLCGIDATMLNRFRDGGNEFGPNTFVGGIGAFAMLICFVCLIVTLVLWAIVGIIHSFSPQAAEPQRLLHKKDDTDPGEPR